jgi:phage gp29-like protein
VPGQTLTTDIGSAGSYAAAQAHNLVREGLAASDRKRIAEDFTRPAKVRAFYNSGEEVPPPKSGFARDMEV